MKKALALSLIMASVALMAPQLSAQSSQGYMIIPADAPPASSQQAVDSYCIAFVVHRIVTFAGICIVLTIVGAYTEGCLKQIRFNRESKMALELGYEQVYGTTESDNWAWKKKGN